MPRRISLALVFAALLLDGAARAAAPGIQQCLSKGPCMVPDSIDMLGGSQPATPILAVNFGLMIPTATPGNYEYVCEEIFGGRIGERARVSASGRMYIPALDGLYHSDDACTWTRATGGFDGQSVWDISFDPTTPGKIWAVGGRPASVAVSLDNGNSFTIKKTFDSNYYVIRVVVSPSDPRIVYLTGYKSMIPLVLWVSTDGGETFAVDETAATGAALPGQVIDLLGVAPDDANTVYYSVTNPKGDEVWKSTSQGHTPVKVLTLDGAGQRYGFSFGQNAATLYVGSRDPLEEVGRAPAAL
jgi:hypothetical protein